MEKTFKIDGMSCGHCVKAVEKGLNIDNLSAKQNKAKYRNPDSLPHPKMELKGLAPYQQVSGSRAIAPHLDLENVRSTSFKHFIRGIRSLCN